MICPHCSTGQIDAATGKCGHCGHAPGESDTLDLPAADEWEAMVKKLLDKEYHVEGLIGRGGMSLVYLAREIELSRLVALKVLPFQLAMGSNTQDRFQREAKIAAGLDHPHIVPVFRVGVTSSFMWYSMKYIKGQSLAEVVEQSGPMPLNTCLDVLGQIASALEHSHRRGIVHRDIKPENVLIDGHGWVWVCDFGVAKAFGSVPLTQTGGTLGTPSYMSPEQCYGEELDPRADQYALAILTYRCLAGELPFKADSVGEMIRKQCMEPPPDIRIVRPDVPEEVSQGLIRAMSKKRGERFANVSAFVEELGGKVALDHGRASLQGMVHALSQRAVGTPRDTPRWRRAARATGLVVAAAGSAAAFVIWSPWNGANASSAGDPIDPASLAQPVNTTAGSDTMIGTTRQVPEQEPDRRGAEPASTTAPPAAESALPALLDVTTSGPWGRVYVNDRYVRDTPVQGHEVPAGSVRIRLERDGFEPFDTLVTPAPGERIQLLQLRLKPVGGGGGG